MMGTLHGNLVLASASERRKEILGTLELPFEVDASDVDETREPDEPALEYVRRVATAKAMDVARRTPERTCVLGADTIVHTDTEVMGKPRDAADAHAMLTRLSGTWHSVTTAIALLRAPETVLEVVTHTTAVRFRELSVEEITGYVDHDEGADKAGGYAIQGLGGGLVAELRGSYHNVVGLPAGETLELLRRHGVLTRWP